MEQEKAPVGAPLVASTPTNSSVEIARRLKPQGYAYEASLRRLEIRVRQAQIYPLAARVGGLCNRSLRLQPPGDVDLPPIRWISWSWCPRGCPVGASRTHGIWDEPQHSGMPTGHPRGVPLQQHFSRYSPFTDPSPGL